MAVTGTEAKIYEALMDKVASVARGLGFNPDLGGAVSFPNVGFTAPVASQAVAGVKKGDRLPYLAVTYMPNTSTMFGIESDSDVDHQGLLQISVFWPAGAGLVKPSQIGAQVASAFAPGTKIDRNGLRVRVDQQPQVSGSLQESDWVQIPVTIRWRAFVPTEA